MPGPARGAMVGEGDPPEVLFYEQGASWAWLLAGPVAGISMAILQITGGAGPDLWIPLIFLVLVSGFIAIQIKAARIHASVELTTETLRQGEEKIRVEQIVAILPEPADKETPQWQSARALGELNGVPKGRTGIGITLAGARTVQAWARKPRGLRGALTQLIDERTP